MLWSFRITFDDEISLMHPGLKWRVCSGRWGLRPSGLCFSPSSSSQISGSGFSAQPGGVRSHLTGAFMNEGYVADFWRSIENNQEQFFFRYLTGEQAEVGRQFVVEEKFKSAGRSIRCIKD
ncbi:MAG TPA: hypothetical protein DDW27_16840 [Bacteroidales bacterium]|nr:hypothetical protein [Bacteroidales bacterium]